MDADTRWEEDDEPEDSRSYVDGAWGRTSNPNTADGELQNMAAFSAGFARLTGPRRTAAQVTVWLILLGFALVILYGVAGIIRIW